MKIFIIFGGPVGEGVSQYRRSKYSNIRVLTDVEHSLIPTPPSPVLLCMKLITPWN